MTGTGPLLRALARFGLHLAFGLAACWCLLFIRGQYQNWRRPWPPASTPGESGYHRYEHGAWRWYSCEPTLAGIGGVDLFCAAMAGRVSCEDENGEAWGCMLVISGDIDGGVRCSDNCALTVAPRKPVTQRKTSPQRDGEVLRTTGGALQRGTITHAEVLSQWDRDVDANNPPRTLP
jgi:hypothetical protein